MWLRTTPEQHEIQILRCSSVKSCVSFRLHFLDCIKPHQHGLLSVWYEKHSPNPTASPAASKLESELSGVKRKHNMRQVKNTHQKGEQEM